ncbi:ribosome biogenesis GTPase Der, partial [Paracoccaceae bacterium]|nr:ribosome biogenesis GTPase Der [Paracoccaceae bacterium]
GDFAGVTRDYKEELLDLKNFQIQLLDTAGLKSSLISEQEKTINRHTLNLINHLDIILFVVDGRMGVTFEDKEIFQVCRKLDKPTILVVNKVETSVIEKRFFGEDINFFGLPNIIFVSSEHRLGIEKVFTALEDICQENKLESIAKEEFNYEKKPINIAIIGRPNVGKSTLVNAIIKKKRFVTGPEAGLTRDSNFVFFDWDNDFFKIYDTAGARKKRKIDNSLEKESVKETLRAIKFAQIVILVLEPDELLNAQDQKLASLCEREGRAVVFVVNKSDKIFDKKFVDEKLKETISKSLPQFKGACFSYISGLKSIGLDTLRENVMKAYSNWNFRQSTSNLNNWLKEKIGKHAPPTNNEKRRIKLKYIVQSNTRPPTIKIFTSHNGIVSKSYKRYLENSFREDFGLPGTPIRIIFKSGDNPFTSSKH